MTQIRDEAFEAICSALYNLDFQPIGEVERNGKYESYFCRGEYPKKIRVGVFKSTLFGSDHIEVLVEWHNVANGTTLKGQQKFTISTRDFRAAVENTVERLVLDVLDIYRQVLAGEGVAGPIAKLVDSPEEVDDSGNGV